jgi:hypothetical protein
MGPGGLPLQQQRDKRVEVEAHGAAYAGCEQDYRHCVQQQHPWRVSGSATPTFQAFGKASRRLLRGGASMEKSSLSSLVSKKLQCAPQQQAEMAPAGGERLAYVLAGEGPKVGHREMLAGW